MRIESSISTFLIMLATASAFAGSTREIARSEKDAVKLAETYLILTYGDEILQEKPFRAKLNGEIWSVDGTLQCKAGEVCKGGVAHVEFNKTDGRLIKIQHER